MRRSILASFLLLVCAACATDPTPTPDTTRWLDSGRAHLALYEWDKAIAAFNQAVGAAPDEAEGYCLRALAYASSPGGRPARDAAMADYTRCLELAPGGPQSDDARRALDILRAAATVAPP